MVAHSSSKRETRAKECKAFSHKCRNCGKAGHFAAVICKGIKVKPEEATAIKNAAVEVTEMQAATVESFAFCSIIAAPTSNVFQPLAGLGQQEEVTPWVRVKTRRSSPTRHQTRRPSSTYQPAQVRPHPIKPSICPCRPIPRAAPTWPHYIP